MIGFRTLGQTFAARYSEWVAICGRDLFRTDGDRNHWPIENTLVRLAHIAKPPFKRLEVEWQYTGHRVRQLFARFGLTGIPPGVRDERDLPGANEWWLPALAAELGVRPIVVHRWRWSGWLTARQLSSDNGRWIVAAGRAETRRRRRLRAFELAHHGRRTPPTELTTPRPPTSSKRRTTHEQSGGE